MCIALYMYNYIYSLSYIYIQKSIYIFIHLSMDMYVGCRESSRRRSLQMKETWWQRKEMERTGWRAVCDNDQGQEVGILFPKTEWKWHSCQYTGSTDSSDWYLLTRMLSCKLQTLSESWPAFHLQWRLDKDPLIDINFWTRPKKS